MHSEFELLQRLNKAQSDPAAAGPVPAQTQEEPWDFETCLKELALRNLNSIAADLEPAPHDPLACEKRARALATVTLALDEIARAKSARAVEVWIVDENDPRACPRDSKILRNALADELDRINEKKNISFL